MTYLIGFVLSFASTVGFGIITNVPKRTLLPSGITGALAWLTYLALLDWNHGVILPNLGAAFVIGLLSNLLAVWVKTPVNVMYIPCLVSLVPGAIIFLSMKDFTMGQSSQAAEGLVKTITMAFALAVGFVAAEGLSRMLRPLIKRLVKA